MTRVLQPGDRIGEAVIEQALGEGGFGCVYRARMPDGEVRAIKVAHAPAEAMSTVELSLLQNEIEAVLRLRHPGLVQTYGYGYLDDGRLYLEMDLVQGIGLIDYVDRPDWLDPIEALAIVERVAEVMAYCHAEGVLHLDLKPENIVLTDRHGPTIKVLDFGVARVARAWSGNRQVIAGTPAYMAPECFGDGPRHPSMDVYALGVTLHVMLTGRLAFEEGGVTTQVEHKYAGPPPLDTVAWERAPAGLRALLRSMLAVNPDKRPTMEALRTQARRLYFAALAGRLDDRPPEITDPEPSQPIHVVGLYGRDAELEALRARFAAAQTEPQRPSLVLGAQGSGKSALLERFLAEHADQPTLVAEGRCRESGDLVPFASIREAAGRLGEALRALPNWRALGRELREALGPLEGVLIALVPEAQPPGVAPVVEPPARPGPEVVARAVSRLLEVVARHRPVILVLEDVQWAGAGVQAVMQSVAAHPMRGVLVLMSGRDRPPWAADLEAIELGALRPEDNAALLRALLATDDPKVIERLQRHVPVLTTGIPMATVLVTADLQLQRCVRRTAGGGVTLDKERLRAYAPPAGVAEVLQRRLSRLDPRARRILAVGALLGRRFHREDIVGTDLHGLYEVQAAMLDAHVLGLARVQDGSCTLAHDTLVERLVSDWDPQEVRTVHARIAQSLERRGIEPGRRAVHLEKAGQPAAAAEVHLQAALHADGLHDLVGAERHFRRAIELAEHVESPETRTALLREAVLEHARVAGALGKLDEAFAVVEIAARGLGSSVETVETVGAVEDFAVDSALARLHYLKGDMSAAVDRGRRCLAHTGDEAHTQRYRVLPANLVGRALYVRGRFGEATVALARGCQLAASEHETMELCHSLAMLGLSLGYTGVLDEARTHLERATQLADETGDPVRRLAALCYQAIGAEYAYDWQLGVLRGAQALDFAQRHEIDGLYRYLSLVVAGRHQFHVGQLSRARLLLEHAVELARRQGLSTGIGWAHAFVGDVAFVQGAYAEAARCYARGLESGHVDEYAAALNLTGRGHLRAYTDRDRGGLDADMQEALRRLAAVDNVAVAAHTLLRHADGLAVLGDEAAAEVARGQARAVFARLGVTPVGWWPAPPTATDGTSPRDHWLARATAEQQRIAPPSAEVLRRVTLEMTEEARTVQQLQVRPGGMKPA